MRPIIQHPEYAVLWNPDGLLLRIPRDNPVNEATNMPHTVLPSIRSQTQEIREHDGCWESLWSKVILAPLVMRLPFAILAATLLLASASLAQQRHEVGHPQYRNWVNQKEISCCNDNDCGEINDADVRAFGDETQVRIDGQWCPIQSWMYLKSGNAPNWAANHVCVVPDNAWLPDRRPCARLRCFQPNPGT